MTGFALAFCLCLLGFLALCAGCEALFAAWFGEELE